jgi:hypothetical protein
MKAGNVLRLNTWVQSKRQWINLEQPSQAQMAHTATTELGFKVSVTALRDILLANGIQTKRQAKHVAEIASLKEELRRVTAILIKVVTTSTVPEWLRKELETEDLTEEVKQAVQKNRNAA